MIKLRKMILVEYAASMEELRNTYKVQSEDLRGKDYLGDLDVDGRTVLK
jgi:hypothetical protein